MFGGSSSMGRRRGERRDAMRGSVRAFYETWKGEGQVGRKATEQSPDEKALS